MPREATIGKTAGENLRSVVSGLLVRNPYEAIKELVSNSFDADATLVTVTYDEADKRLTIEDDGHGMTEDGLVGFLRMGDSEKQGNPLSPAGRTRIGKFGIATVLLEYLGEGYTLTTSRDGNTVQGQEDFSEENGLEYVVGKSVHNASGTTIAIHPCREKAVGKLRIPKLRSVLAWEVPYQDDFVVRVNGEQVQRVNDEPTRVFNFDEQLEHAGRVQARIHYFERKPRMSGVHVYVNERSVGDASSYDFLKISRSLAGRIHAEIHADDLQDHISFDRSRFNEDNPAFSEFSKWLDGSMRKVRAELRERKPTTKKALTYSQRSDVAAKVTRGLKQDNSNGSKRSKAETAPVRGVNLHLVRSVSQTPSTLDVRTNELRVNTNHAIFANQEGLSPDVFEMLVRVGASYGGINADEHDVSEGQQVFTSLCNAVLPSVDDDRSRRSSRSGSGFIDDRLYSGTDLRSASIPSFVMNRLQEAGVLREHDGKFRGADVNNYLMATKSASPAMVLVREHEESRGLTRARVQQVYISIDDHIKNRLGGDNVKWLNNLGTEEPFFVVDNAYADRFIDMFSKGALGPLQNGVSLDETQHLLAAAEGTQRQEHYMTLAGLSGALRLTPREVLEVLSDAKRNGGRLRVNAGANNLQYNLSDVKKLYERGVASE